jgi:hypothetical protein
MAKVCARKMHRWDSDGRVCTVCGARRTRLPKNKQAVVTQAALVPLRYGSVYCESCRSRLNAGDRVAWGRVRAGKRLRPAVYCPGCRSAARV